MNQTIRSRAPLRLGFAGGGTDVSPYCEEHGGNVLNATIDLYAQTILEPRNDGKVVFVAAERGERVELPALPVIPDEEPLRLHRGIYSRMVRQFNGGRPLSLSITTFADAPAGSGLGTSSTMVVSMIQAYAEWLRLGLGEYDIARLAYEVERIDLGFAGGRQDQYAATFGGFNFMEFGANDRVLVNPLRVKEWVLNELEASTVLYYTGVSRESAVIIQRQIDSAKRGDVKSLDAMHSVKQDALAMKEAILRGDLLKYAEVLGRSWKTKKQIVQGITNAGIDEVYEAAMAAGAISGKISGAGGGGFMMLFVPAALRMNVIQALEPFPGEVVNFHFTQNGAQSWCLN